MTRLYRRPQRSCSRLLHNRCDRCEQIQPLVWRSDAGKFYCEECGVEKAVKEGAEVRT